MKKEIVSAVLNAISTYWIVAIIVMTAILIGFLSLLWLPSDNPIEQRMEIIIRDETGLKVDLTPSEKLPMKLKYK